MMLHPPGIDLQLPVAKFRFLLLSKYMRRQCNGRLFC